MKEYASLHGLVYLKCTVIIIEKGRCLEDMLSSQSDTGILPVAIKALPLWYFWYL